jgi:hypothetical protein
MVRYLTFQIPQPEIKESLFAGYTLSNASLLPSHFGSINPVNILLGENNSGKSRFMREIMKTDVKQFELDFSADDVIAKLDAVCKLIESLPIDSFFDLTLKVTHYEIEETFLLLFDKSKKDLGSSVPTYTISPQKLIKELKAVVNKLIKAASTPGSFLSFLDLDETDSKYLEALITSLGKIRRAASAYEQVAPKEKFGSNFTNNVGSDAIEFRHPQSFAVLGLVTGSSNSYQFREPGKRSAYAAKHSSLLNDLQGPIQNVIDLLKPLTKVLPRKPTRTYIPTLRTARTLIGPNGAKLQSDSDIMRITTMLDYDLANSGAEVDTGFALYDAIDTKRNARIEGRTSFTRFEEFLSETFFNGKPVAVVAERVKDVRGGNILITIDGVERDIQHLGDGIQAIILLLYPLFIASESAWFFIEEPETHLHPGFQRLFIETITTHPVLKAKNLTIFLTTHSNHILDFAIAETDRVNIFSFRKAKETIGKPAYQIQLTARHDLEALAALGVQNSSVFLANCTIWVEGITDRIYLTAYLKAYLKHLQSKVSLIEGLHYSFLEYAGANVAHYTFNAQSYDGTIPAQTLQDIKGMSISNRIMLIADQDAGKKTKRDERLIDEQNPGFAYRILDVREIENLLSPEVIAETLHKLYKKKFDASFLKVEEYQQKYLGSYLRSKFSSIPDNFAPTDGSGTIGTAKKRLFAEKAAESITSWQSLTPEAQKLTEQIFKFIIDHNPRLGRN